MSLIAECVPFWRLSSLLNYEFVLEHYGVHERLFMSTDSFPFQWSVFSSDETL